MGSDADMLSSMFRLPRALRPWTLPVTVVTLGFFLLVVNAAMFGLVAALLDNFYVGGFFSALFGWLIVSVTAIIASWFIGPSGRYEVLIIEHRR